MHILTRRRCFWITHPGSKILGILSDTILPTQKINGSWKASSAEAQPILSLYSANLYSVRVRVALKELYSLLKRVLDQSMLINLSLIHI